MHINPKIKSSQRTRSNWEYKGN